MLNMDFRKWGNQKGVLIENHNPGGSVCLLSLWNSWGARTQPACASAEVADDVASLSATDVGTKFSKTKVVDWLKPWFLLLYHVCCPKKFTVHCSFNGRRETSQKIKGQDVQTGLHRKWIEMATLNPLKVQGASTCGKEQVKQPTTPLASSNEGYTLPGECSILNGVSTWLAWTFPSRAGWLSPSSYITQNLPFYGFHAILFRGLMLSNVE